MRKIYAAEKSELNIKLSELTRKKKLDIFCQYICFIPRLQNIWKSTGKQTAAGEQDPAHWLQN